MESDEEAGRNGGFASKNGKDKRSNIEKIDTRGMKGLIFWFHILLTTSCGWRKLVDTNA